MMKKLSFIPIPVAHVLRDGKRYLLDFKDIVAGDIVFLDSNVSGIIPADIVLFETGPDFIISSYLDTFDHNNRHFYEFRENKTYEIPPTATNKSAKYTPPPAEGTTPLETPQEPMPDFILDSPNFVPMGSRLYNGQGKGICIKIGNNSTKGLLR